MSKTGAPILTAVGGELAESFPTSSSRLVNGAITTYAFPASTSKAWFVRVYPQALSGSYEYISGNTVVGFFLRHTVASNQWGYYDGSVIRGSGETLSTGKWFNLLICQDYINATSTFRAYRDGNLITSGAATNSMWGNQALYHNDFGGGSIGSACALALMARFTGYLPHDLAIALTQDPYKTIFEPKRFTVGGASAAGTTYILSPGGVVTLSSSTTLIRNRQLAPTGAVTLSAAAPVLRNKQFTPSGAVTFAASATYKREKSFGTFGSIVFSGSAALSSLATYILTASGIVNFTGSATYSHVRLQTAGQTGLVTFSGTSGITFIPSGGIPSTGVSRISIGVNRSARLS
jgi:hypothetical protein